ncbi:alpha/beta fold hydrolase [Jiella sonneratiae]|uniref:Alpha/beta fold hydrolase n=1 Tax=Jiella sonneratiae TaxID=2816856 RepID=A0ABS3J6W3_9HYPH|nr:alpha/beta fold hydrolase [Jiella sonneratiae]
MSTAVSPEARLHAEETGGGDRPPFVFLHGFDGRAEAFAPVMAALAADGERCLAFDLPGHGRSRAYPGFGPPKVAARAVIAALRDRGIGKVHVVGHSMGGAVACLVALFDAARVASLTLLAPGGFGPEIGAEPIRRVMEAADPQQLKAGLQAMTAPRFSIEEAGFSGSNWPEGRDEIRSIFDALFRSGRQGVLPLDAVAATGLPIEVLWGREDPVTPVRQSDGLPAGFAVTRLAGVGHMLMLEAPGETLAAIGRAASRAEAG